MKILIIFIVAVFILGIGGSASGSIISFVTDSSFSDVDDTTGFSNTDAAVNLDKPSLDLLGGTGKVTGYKNGSKSNLTHRGTRGLGVSGGEFDEVDNYWCSAEKIEITFDILQYLNYLEVRSLFSPDTGWNPGTELGAVDFMRSNSTIHTEYLFGQEALGGENDGDVEISYSTPWLVDKLVFYVPLTVPTSYPDYSSLTNCWQKFNIITKSEFALAKLDVEPIPEPTTMLLLGSGLLGLAVLGRRRKRS